MIFMTLDQWNKMQLYLFGKFRIDPKDYVTIARIACCIGEYKVHTLVLKRKHTSVAEHRVGVFRIPQPTDIVCIDSPVGYQDHAEE